MRIQSIKYNIKASETLFKKKYIDFSKTGKSLPGSQ
jgi:hypothetical protein